jgi:lysophospholipase L1-like esterase
MKLKFSFWNKKYKLKKSSIILMLFLGLVLGGLLSEGLIRVFTELPEFNEYGKFRHLAGISIPKENIDPVLFWKDERIFSKEKYSKYKKSGIFRIICIGDSVTQGYLPKASVLRQSTYPFYLERILNQKHINETVEVINAGVGGYSSLQGLRYLENQLIDYSPDLVISWFGVNDCSRALFYEDKDQKIGINATPKRRKIFEYSKLYFFITNIIFKPKLLRVSEEDYYKNCKGMLLLSKKYDFNIIFIKPFEIVSSKIKYFERYKRALDRLEKEYGCKVIDVADVLKTYDNYDQYFIDSCHFNMEGNKIAAKIISDILAETQWLKK